MCGLPYGRPLAPQMCSNVCSCSSTSVYKCKANVKIALFLILMKIYRNQTTRTKSTWTACTEFFALAKGICRMVKAKHAATKDFLAALCYFLPCPSPADANDKSIEL